jgi:beta-glucuronidase
MPSRRNFLTGSLALAAALPAPAAPDSAASITDCVSLNGGWQFRFDGEPGWKVVTVPHTWQIASASADYYGVAWYQRTFEAPKEWASSAIRIEFEAVFHSATVWVNGQPAGEHLRKGYTAFTLDITRLIRFGEVNTLRVRVENTFDDRMLPRGRSSDWTHDGGIYRPVNLLVTPKVFIERVEIDVDPDLARSRAELRVRALVHNSGAQAAEGAIDIRAVDETSGLTVLERSAAARYTLKPGESAWIDAAPAAIDEPRLWHFDHHTSTACMPGSPPGTS